MKKQKAPSWQGRCCIVAGESQSGEVKWCLASNRSIRQSLIWVAAKACSGRLHLGALTRQASDGIGKAHAILERGSSGCPSIAPGQQSRLWRLEVKTHDLKGKLTRLQVGYF